MHIAYIDNRVLLTQHRALFDLLHSVFDGSMLQYVCLCWTYDQIGYHNYLH